MKNEIENMLNKVSYEIEKHINDGYTEEMLVPLEFDVTHWQFFKNYIKQKEERIAYLERSLNRKEETITELELERVPYTNEYVEKVKMENEELKKRLEEKEEIACNWKDSCLENAGKIEKTENQQKEFIKYLKSINSFETIGNILNKYKEIIGTDIHVGSKGGNK